MRADRRVQIVQLLHAGQPHFHDLQAHGAYQVEPHRPLRIPRGYICVRDSAFTSASPTWRNNSDTRRPIAGSAPLRLKTTGKISQIRSNARFGG